MRQEIKTMEQAQIIVVEDENIIALDIQTSLKS